MGRVTVRPARDRVYDISSFEGLTHHLSVAKTGCRPTLAAAFDGHQVRLVDGGYFFPTMKLDMTPDEWIVYSVACNITIGDF
jgi:hypothetical protein